MFSPLQESNVSTASWSSYKTCMKKKGYSTFHPKAERGGTLIAFISDAGVFAAPRQTIIGAARAATTPYSVKSRPHLPHGCIPAPRI